MIGSDQPPIRDIVVDTLTRLPLFADLSVDERAAVARGFAGREFDRDAILFFEGEQPVWLHIVAVGHVKLVKYSDEGREVIVHVAMPGDIMGGVAAFGRRPYPFTAQAMVPTTTLRIAGEEYAAIMRRHPAVATATLNELVDELVEAHETMKSLATERVERRIARQLLTLVDRAGRPVPAGIEIGVPLSRQDVADIAGTTVETAIRVLSRWRRRGSVATIDGHIVVTDLAGIRSVAEEERDW